MSSLNYITAINVQKQYYYDLNFKADLDKKMVEQKEFKDVQLQKEWELVLFYQISDF